MTNNPQILTLRNKPRRRIVKHMDAPNCIRVYRESPESVHFQIRMVDQFAGISLQFEEAEKLAALILDARHDRLVKGA